jgi:hypothetical protein
MHECRYVCAVSDNQGRVWLRRQPLAGGSNPDAPPTYYDIRLFVRLQIVEVACLLDDTLGIGTISEVAYLLDHSLGIGTISEVAYLLDHSLGIGTISEVAYLLDHTLGIGTISEFAYLLDELPTPALPSVV